MLQQNASPFIPILAHAFQFGFKLSADILYCDYYAGATFKFDCIDSMSTSTF